MDVLKAVVTTVLIVAFAAFVAFLLHEAAVSQQTWERYVYLLNGFEAIVFAGAGWFFGKEVHRERAEKAEEKATQASAGQVAAVKEAAAEKQKGLSLAQSIVSQVNETPRRLQTLDVQLGDEHRAEISSIAKLARDLYPEVS
jgi:ABC-type transport system involved in cytochrome bd biosynthesis fused ATPase/permease subunit